MKKKRKNKVKKLFRRGDDPLRLDEASLPEHLVGQCVNYESSLCSVCEDVFTKALEYLNIFNKTGIRPWS